MLNTEINPSDLKIENYGHINSWAVARPSGVRITHIPTAIVAECNEHRSEFANKHQAMKDLKRQLRASRASLPNLQNIAYNPHPDFERFMYNFFLNACPNMPMEYLHNKLRRGNGRAYSDSTVYVAFKAFLAGRASHDSK